MSVVLHEYVCTMCMLGWGGQMRVSYPVELALQMVVNLHAGAGNWTMSSGRALMILTVEPSLQFHIERFELHNAIMLTTGTMWYSNS